MKDVLRLIRPEQWIKNGFVFMPLFFNRQIGDSQKLACCLLVFFAFCFISSAIYCLNDIIDIDADKLHPVKHNRPIASGRISVFCGYIIMITMSIIGLGLISLLPTDVLTNVFIIITIYILLNVAYCLHLKKYAILDVFIIAIGFVMRVIAGGTATSIWVTHWIVLMTFLLSLFLSFAKRRDDVILFSETGMQPRKNTNRYNLDFINQALTIVGSITMVCYIMYTVSPEVIERMGTKYLYLTSLFVLAGIIRYMQLTIVDDKSGSPTKILIKDRFIQLCIIGWAVAFFIILYVI